MKFQLKRIDNVTVYIPLPRLIVYFKRERYFLSELICSNVGKPTRHMVGVNPYHDQQVVLSVQCSHNQDMDSINAPADITFNYILHQRSPGD